MMLHMQFMTSVTCGLDIDTYVWYNENLGTLNYVYNFFLDSTPDSNFQHQIIDYSLEDFAKPLAMYEHQMF